MRANHDVQYLFSQTEAVAKIYYAMKYITKTEDSTYSKLMIAAAVAKSLATSGRNDKGKVMLIRTYNKISSHQEVGIPEVISHLVDLPDTLTGGVFENIHTTHLLNYIKKCNGNRGEVTMTDLGDCSIIRVGRKTKVISLFDDYAHHGPGLSDMCLYDYCSLVYKSLISKSPDIGGLPFDPFHPQHTTYRQFVRMDTSVIPTLLGRLLFLRPDSGDEAVRSDHFCLLTGVVVPWSHVEPPQKLPNISWETHFVARQPHLHQRILRYVDNLALLHKWNEEAIIDQLRLHAQVAGENDDEDGNPSRVQFDMATENHEDDEIWDLEGNRSTTTLAVVQSALEGSLDSTDTYVGEAMEANFTNGYFEMDTDLLPSLLDTPTLETNTRSDVQIFTAMDMKLLNKLMKDAASEEETNARIRDDDDVTPGVFLTGSDVSLIALDFSLNPEQALAFRIICNHALGHHAPSDPHLLMGVFGKGGTGKSRLINAIRAWFRKNGRKDELIVAATTGSAAVKIKGTTVHSAVSIPIERSDGKRKAKLTTKQVEEWQKHRYMVIDEISMLDCRVMEHLHNQLIIAKSNPDVIFGGVNIIFFSDFLQLPAVINPDLYVDNQKYGVGHRLWRSLNAVTILRQQMRQAEDSLYAGILFRIRLRIPTDDDIEILKTRIGVCLPNM
jgi:hypothetical protein